MKEIETWTASIHIGLRKGYGGQIGTAYAVQDICQEFCDSYKWCVTVTPTLFVYESGKLRGNEPGAIVGIMQYPRFPLDIKELKTRTLALARILMKATNQYRVSIVFLDKTVMLENDEFVED